jgi:hypothetical protein
MPNFLAWIKQKRLPDWRTDLVYKLVFTKVEDSWKFSKRNKNPKIWQYVLIEEWSAAEGGHCRGKVLRLWIRDAQGLRQIRTRHYTQYRSQLGSGNFPFIINSFHISLDKTCIVFCHREAHLAGQGGRYIVAGGPNKPELLPDPSGGFWRS